MPSALCVCARAGMCVHACVRASTVHHCATCLDLHLVPLQKSKPSKSQAEKLKELELSGLVDFDQQHARYSR